MPAHGRPHRDRCPALTACPLGLAPPYGGALVALVLGRDPVGSSGRVAAVVPLAPLVLGHRSLAQRRDLAAQPVDFRRACFGCVQNADLGAGRISGAKHKVRVVIEAVAAPVWRVHGPHHRNVPAGRDLLRDPLHDLPPDLGRGNGRQGHVELAGHGAVAPGLAAVELGGEVGRGGVLGASVPDRDRRGFAPIVQDRAAVHVGRDRRRDIRARAGSGAATRAGYGGDVGVVHWRKGKAGVSGRKP